MEQLKLEHTDVQILHGIATIHNSQTNPFETIDVDTSKQFEHAQMPSNEATVENFGEQMVSSMLYGPSTSSDFRTTPKSCGTEGMLFDETRDQVIAQYYDNGMICDSSGILNTEYMYLNQITPRKRSFEDEIEKADVEIIEPGENAVVNLPIVNNDASEHVMHECPILGCSKSVKLESSLTRHIKQFHGELRPTGLYGIMKYVCAQCNRRCMSSNNLKQHFQQQHREFLPKYKTDWDDVEPLQYK